MLQDRHVARDISYAHSARSRSSRALIRTMENATGRIGLIKRAHGYERDMRDGRDIWQVMVDRFGLTLEVMDGCLSNIPREGPLVMIANHPYGILDGLMMAHILCRTRSDFRKLAHEVFSRAPDLGETILPISFDETKAAMHINLETRRKALRYLEQDGAIGVFPGGAVSTSAKPFGTPMDPGWRGFTARMITRADATVLPVFFDGHTSRLFQLASHLHATLRMGLLVKEFRTRVDTPVAAMWFDAKAALVELMRGDMSPRKSPARQSPPAERAEKPELRVAPVACVARPPATKGETFQHGLTPEGRPKTWTERVVSLEEWRALIEWERHGPNGRMCNGVNIKWKAKKFRDLTRL
ncbi:Acyltransferase [Roseivivax lentus]|uniref:Acyltransferase n=1 Tax=Roseivivax lentus TaxID=633194 RepID=A0A1N7KCP7_9RHOB|nr:Acyltransferase [Roseivivax lentus]